MWSRSKVSRPADTSTDPKSAISPLAALRLIAFDRSVRHANGRWVSGQRRLRPISVSAFACVPQYPHAFPTGPFHCQEALKSLSDSADGTLAGCSHIPHRELAGPGHPFFICRWIGAHGPCGFAIVRSRHIVNKETRAVLVSLTLTRLSCCWAWFSWLLRFSRNYIVY